MHDFVVYRDTQRRRKPAIAFERGLRALTRKRVRRDPVELEGGHAGLEGRLQELERMEHDGIRLVHLVELFVGSTSNHALACPSPAEAVADVRNSDKRSNTSSILPFPSTGETRCP